MSRARAYAQLVRLPNVFTALADICLGAWGGQVLTGGTPAGGWWGRFGLLLAASACLYSGGMVFNDVFDVEQDRRERPFRPIPSGRVSRRTAAGLGTALLAAGVVAALLSGRRPDDWHLAPALLAAALVAAILLYDVWLKRTWAGPLGMGACRFFNVLLGLSAVDAPAGGRGVYLAAVVGLYIVGVTWFARTEARASSRGSLAGAAAVMLAGLVLALPLGEQAPPATRSSLYVYLLVALGFLVGVPVCRAVGNPAPAAVQSAVKRAILGLVVLDATLATGLVGVAGLVLLLLLLPTLYLGRWIYST
jgi:4-hydroxybenzoate polyprenyltransferase